MNLDEVNVAQRRATFAAAVSATFLIDYALSGFEISFLHFGLFVVSWLFLLSQLHQVLELPTLGELFVTENARKPAGPSGLVASSATATASSSTVDAAAGVTEDEQEATSETAETAGEAAAATGALDHRHAEMVAPMVNRFLSLADNNNKDDWNVMVDSSVIQVSQRKGTDHCFRIRSQLDQTAFSAFDYLVDVARRPEWDEMCVEGRVVEELSPNTRIVYLRMKPVWPTAARDVVVLSHVCRLSDGRLLNVTKSVEHPQIPERTGDNIIRMEAGIAGQLLWPVDNFGTKRCHIIQIADGNPKGWIPAAVIKFLATVAMPKSFQNLNRICSKEAPKEKSDAIARAETAVSSSAQAGKAILANASAAAVPAGAKAAPKAAAQNLNSLIGDLKSLNTRLAALETKVVSSSSAQAGGSGAVVHSQSRLLVFVKNVFSWASPFMISAIYVIIVYAAVGILKRRQR